MDEASPETRKTVSFTHRQLGWTGGGVIAALALFTQLKGSFFTREEGSFSMQQVMQIRTDVADLRNDMTIKNQRLADKIMDRIREAEERTVKNADRIERRIDLIELAAKNYVKSKRSND
jgi:hypothetical protein